MVDCEEVALLVRTLAEGVGGERQAAERRIGDLEGSAGFVEALIVVASSRGVVVTVARLMAVICLKNNVRRRRCDEASKGELRKWLVSGALREADRLVGAQIVDLVGRVARADWPRKWPQVLARLADVAFCQRERLGAEALAETLKVLATKRLPADRRALEAASEELVPRLLSALGTASSPEDCASIVESLGVVAARTARRSEEVIDALARAMRSPAPLDDVGARAAVDVSRVRGSDSRFVAIAAECRLPAHIELLTIAVDQQTFVVPESVVASCLPLLATTPEDLELWDSDPEEFALRDGDEDSDTPRAKAEALFATLAETLAPRLATEFLFTEPLRDDTRTDALLRALGVCAFALEEEEEDSWTTVSRWCSCVALPALRELRIQNGGKRLRRRLYWLFRCCAFGLGDDVKFEISREAQIDAARPHDLALRIAALDACVRPSLDVALDLAVDASEPDHVAAALGAAYRSVDTPSAADYLSARLFEIRHPEAPTTLSAVADAAAAAAPFSTSDAAIFDRCARLLAALLDRVDACGPSACRLWLQLLRSCGTRPPDHPLFAAQGARLASLVSPPRDLSLARRVAKISKALLALSLPIDFVATMTPLAAQVNDVANVDVDDAIEFAALARPGLAAPLAPALRADLRGKTGPRIACHLAVLHRLAIFDPYPYWDAWCARSHLAVARPERPRRAKLAALAALSLLAKRPSLDLLDRLDDLLGLVAEALHFHLDANIALVPQNDDDDVDLDDDDDGKEENNVVVVPAPLDACFAAHAASDPVLRADLRQCARDALDSAISLGLQPHLLHDALSAVEPTTLSLLGLLL